MTTRLLMSRSGLLVPLFLFLLPLHVSAQSSVGSIQLNPALSREAPSTLNPGWFNRAASRELARLDLAVASPNSALLQVQQPGQRQRSWIGRHPVLFGTLVGFGGGFLIGYLPGDDAVFDDFVASFNGLVLGGVGAGTGALVGAIVGAAQK